MNEETNASEITQETKPAGYCRMCGKALAAEQIRTSHGAVYCDEHLPPPEAKTPPPAPPPPRPDSPWTSAAPSSASVSPGLAFLLGLIPGVGAIYNSQYAKGLVHVVVFGLLVAIVDSDAAGGLGPLFGFLIAAWIFYMAFEAYHTAKKRQFGEPVDEFSSLFPLKSGGNSMTGPIVLIAGGVLFLLVNLKVIRLYDVVQFWPVMLIALGLYLLYVRVSAAKRPGDGL